MMKLVLPLLFAFSATWIVGGCNDNDRFSYKETQWQYREFGPDDWSEVQCDNINNCPGWPTDWHALSEFIDYENTENTCLSCPAPKKNGECLKHNQSPINLEKGATAKRLCKDWHRMHYNEGNCKFGQMRFEILPHVLRAYQPRDPCQVPPCIDFSWGFPDPWLLKFTDISVPSQHTFEGQPYAGEIVLSHVLDVDKPGKEVGNVSWLLEEGEESDVYDFLELYIRRWQGVAARIEEDCSSRRMLRATGQVPLETAPTPAAAPRRLSQILPTDWNGEGEAPEPMQHLTRPYFNRTFHPYDWYDESGSQYYFRYEGSMMEPPCLEKVHWRVMRLPIKVAPSQIRALEDLLSQRIDPSTCEEFTAGRPRGGGSTAVDVNRPSQSWRPIHRVEYCECQDFESPTVKDQEYCALPMQERGVYPYPAE